MVPEMNPALPSTMKTNIRKSGVNAIILSGGKNTRMRGEDKAFLEIEGRPIITILIDRLKALVNEIIIVTNSPQRYTNFKVQLVRDERPDKGPLMGIYSGLKSSSSKYNFIVACDMPFIDPKLIGYMDKLKAGFDIVVPRLKRGHEALFAIYSKDCLTHIYEILHTDNFRITQLFDKVKIKEIREEEINKFGDPDILFMNVNTPEDLCRISTSQKK